LGSPFERVDRMTDTPEMGSHGLGTMDDGSILAPHLIFFTVPVILDTPASLDRKSASLSA